MEVTPAEDASTDARVTFSDELVVIPQPPPVAGCSEYEGCKKEINESLLRHSLPCLFQPHISGQFESRYDLSTRSGCPIHRFGVESGRLVYPTRPHKRVNFLGTIPGASLMEHLFTGEHVVTTPVSDAVRIQLVPVTTPIPDNAQIRMLPPSRDFAPTLHFVSDTLTRNGNTLYHMVYLVRIMQDSVAFTTSTDQEIPLLRRWGGDRDLCYQSISLKSSAAIGVKEDLPYLLVVVPCNSLKTEMTVDMMRDVRDVLDTPRLFVNDENNTCRELLCNPRPFQKLPGTFICAILERAAGYLRLTPARENIYQDLGDRQHVIMAIRELGHQMVIERAAKICEDILCPRQPPQGVAPQTATSGTGIRLPSKLRIIPYTARMDQFLTGNRCHADSGDYLILMITDSRCRYFIDYSEFYRFIQREEISSFCSSNCNWLGAILCGASGLDLCTPRKTTCYGIECNDLLHLDSAANLMFNGHFTAENTSVLLHINDLLSWPMNGKIYGTSIFNHNCVIRLVGKLDSTSINFVIPGEFYTAFNRCRVLRHEFGDEIYVPGFTVFRPQEPFMCARPSGIEYLGDYYNTAHELALCLSCVFSTSGVLDSIMHDLSRVDESFVRRTIVQVIYFTRARCAANVVFAQYVVSRLLAQPQLTDRTDPCVLLGERCRHIFGIDDFPTPSTVRDSFFHRPFISLRFEPAAPQKAVFFIVGTYHVVKDYTILEMSRDEYDRHGTATLFMVGDRLLLPSFDEKDMAHIIQYLFYGCKDACPPTALTIARTVVDYLDSSLSVQHFSFESDQVIGTRNALLATLGSLIISEDVDVHDRDAITVARTLVIYLLASFSTDDERMMLHSLFYPHGSCFYNDNITSHSMARLLAIVGLWDVAYPITLCEASRHQHLELLLYQNVPEVVYQYLHELGTPLCELTRFVVAYVTGFFTLKYELNALLLSVIEENQGEAFGWNSAIYYTFNELFSSGANMNMIAERLEDVSMMCLIHSYCGVPKIQIRILQKLTSAIHDRLPGIAKQLNPPGHFSSLDICLPKPS